MDIVHYPPACGSPRLVSRYDKFGPPPFWVGPTKHINWTRTLPEALSFESGVLEREYYVRKPKAKVKINLSPHGVRNVRRSSYINRISYTPCITAKMSLQSESDPQRAVIA